jgi:hypothetical protein
MTDPLRTPRAVPVSFRSPAQVALKEPPADVAVWSVTFHWKFEQVLGEGMMFVEDQLPDRAPIPVVVGPRVLLCSNSRQPVDKAAIIETAAASASFFIVGSANGRFE